MFNPGTATIEHGYKVVRKRNGKLYSCIVAFPNCTEYPLREWVRRKGEVYYGPLAVFGSLELGKTFVSTGCITRDLYVYKCEYISSEQSGLWRPMPRTGSSITSTNTAISLTTQRLSQKNIPEGTLYADAVRLLCECS